MPFVGTYHVLVALVISFEAKNAIGVFLQNAMQFLEGKDPSISTVRHYFVHENETIGRHVETFFKRIMTQKMA